MDVQTPQLKVGSLRVSWFAIATFAILLLACALRLKGIHDPILDHPAWRQGDTASIARNFARLNFNVMYPQTNYDGPPPNYVELELQIVPFLAALLYKIFGVHEIFGRLITLAFSLGTVGVLALFGRWLFNNWVAGIAAALTFAIVPGSVYYGRTFMPDATMVFFLTAALYASARFLVEDEVMAPRPLARTTALLTFAYLAKPVSVIGIVPLILMLWQRLRNGRTLRPTAAAVLLFVPLFILYFYTRRVSEHAEWHWASGIMQLHVLPELRDAFTNGGAFVRKAQQFWAMLGVLTHTMLGGICTVAALLGIVVAPRVAARMKVLLWGWLAAGLAYTYVVVTVERVDYYMFLLLPLAALFIGALAVWCMQYLRAREVNAPLRIAAAAATAVLIALTVVQGQAAVAPYYTYSKSVYRNTLALSQLLDPKALVVVGHYGPDVLYTMDRYGWEEDPALWTPFDEKSAIKKGARYYISIETRSLHRNMVLCAWLQRFPIINPKGVWPVYDTDPAKQLPGGLKFFNAFLTAQKHGRARAFLNDQKVCML